MDRTHCRDNRLSSPVRVNLWRKALVWLVGAFSLALWTSAHPASTDHVQKSNNEIAVLCNNAFGVKFPMFAKTVVKGESANPLYKQLAQASGEQPGWSFYKYLINRKGETVSTFKNGASPTSPQLTQAIRRALDAHPITEL